MTTRFPDSLREARERADLSLERAARQVANTLPESYEISWSTLGRLERSGDETKADPILVAALASIYGVELDAISEVIDQAFDRVRDLLERISVWESALAA